MTEPGCEPLSRSGPGQQFTTQNLEMIRDFVREFVAAWHAGDASRLGRFFTEDAVYVNGPLPAVHGRDAISAALQKFMAMGGEISVDLRHIVANDDVIMTERIDYVDTDKGRITLPVMGVFECREGRISAWRDYFDMTQLGGLSP